MYLSEGANKVNCENRDNGLELAVNANCRDPRATFFYPIIRALGLMDLIYVYIRGYISSTRFVLAFIEINFARIHNEARFSSGRWREMRNMSAVTVIARPLYSFSFIYQLRAAVSRGSTSLYSRACAEGTPAVFGPGNLICARYDVFARDICIGCLLQSRLFKSFQSTCGCFEFLHRPFLGL